MWATMSMLQMLSYLTLVNINYPGNMLSFFDCIEGVHNSNMWIPNVFSYIFNKDDLGLEPYNKQYEDRGLGHRNFLLLCNADLVVMLLMLLAIGVLLLLAGVWTYYLRVKKLT